MKIALLNTIAPFIWGGAEIHVDDLSFHLRRKGHDVDIFRFPLSECYSEWGKFALFASTLRFDDYDIVVCFKFPTYCISHPNKIVWLLHQFRQVYELYGTEFGLEKSLENDGLRQLFILIDNNSFSTAKVLFTNGGEVANRLLTYNQRYAEVINPPLVDTSKYYCESTGDYFFYPSRINSFKRQMLAVEAMQYVVTDVRLIIAGVFESDEYKNKIFTLIKKVGLSSKVIVKDLWIPENEKLHLMANALGCIFIPYREDYGYITAEAFYSHKPVITCTDSGGPTEFVQEGFNGYVTAPEPRIIAQAMDKMYLDKQKSKLMGELAYESMLAKNITWDETIRRLLA